MTARDLILPSFFGDALALGPHWIYDAAEIRRHYPAGIQHYDMPRSSYHPGKRAGDFTHYGDQALLLLESISRAGTSWNAETWRKDWAAWWRSGPRSYRDGATSHTLEHLDNGSLEPSDSSDLGGGTRIAPLFLLADSLDVEQLVALARAQTAVTHGDPQVADAAEFLIRAASAVSAGSIFEEAFDEAASSPYDALHVSEWLSAARDAATAEDFEKEARRLGIACDIEGAFPVMLALAFRYEDQPTSALEANALLGGDSAARGLGLGLLLGARHGADAFPADWATKLVAHEEIDHALAAAK
jgi:ADP-ribosylglycohydrolase